MEHLLEMLAVAVVSGVVSGLISYGGIQEKLAGLRRDVDNHGDEIKEARSIAHTALSTATTALEIINRRHD